MELLAETQLGSVGLNNPAKEPEVGVGLIGAELFIQVQFTASVNLVSAIELNYGQVQQLVCCQKDNGASGYNQCLGFTFGPVHRIIIDAYLQTGRTG